METDLPLKTLVAARAADLLPLLGIADAEVIGVESLELPATATRLDTALRLRTRRGAEYLHVVEWQGYKDLLFLWRVLGYLGWLGQNRAERPIAITIVYLHPSDDVGDSILQEVDGGVNWSVTFRCVRLWELDAATAVASGRPGLAVLSPLMGGASQDLVEAATTVVLEQVPPSRQQADLLTILGIFAEPYLPSEQFVRIVGREQLMASSLINYLVEERVAELEQERAALEEQRAAERAALEEQRAAERAALEQQRAAERAALEQQLADGRAALEQAVGDTIIARFPTAPVALIGALRQIRDPRRLLRVHQAALQAPDQQALERVVREAANGST